MSVFIGRVTENEPEGFVNIVLTEGEKPSRNFYKDMHFEVLNNNETVLGLSMVGLVSIIDSDNVTFFIDNPGKIESLKIGDKVLLWQ